MVWTTDGVNASPVDQPEAETTVARWSVVDAYGTEVDGLTVNGDTWRAIESDGLLSSDALFEDVVTQGATLFDALSAQINSVVNTYEHCRQSWDDTWSCACNDRCPECNAEIEPARSVWLRSLDERDDGTYSLTTAPDGEVEESHSPQPAVSEA